MGARQKITTTYAAKAARSYTPIVVARSETSAASANSISTTNSTSQMMTAPGAPGTGVFGCAKFCATAANAADNGVPAFFPPSLRIGKTPVAAFSTSSHPAKTAAGMSQARSSAPGRSRRRAIWIIRTIPSTAGTTSTISRVSAP